MTWFRAFQIVTLCALLGMVMGGLVGLAAGAITDNRFTQRPPWQFNNPRGMVTFQGATAGVLAGDGLGGFALPRQAAHEYPRQRRS